MKQLAFLILFLPLFGFSQTDTLKGDSSKVDTIKPWVVDGILGANFTQSTFTNWSGGGENSVSGTALFSLSTKFTAPKTEFDSKLDLAYGRVFIGTQNRKSEDKIDFSTKYGRKSNGYHWFYSFKFGFKSQFDKGYDYPNDSVISSNFLVPAHLTYAIGMDYKPKDYFSVLIAPLSAKTTIVNDQTLADAGAYGVDKAVYDTAGALITPGKKIRHEFGGSITVEFSKDLGKNVKLTTSLDLFSNYLEKAGNVDVNWETLLLLKVNKYISATVSTELIYDDDTHVPTDNDGDGIKESSGPRTQFKEVIGIGLSYKF